MKVLCAMSGGVDSSVAALELLRAGHHVVGVTMRLWGGASDSGCCSVADVDDARRVAHQLGIDHLVFNFTEEFDEAVVAPYVAAHAAGSTPNPCVACNRHLKFDRLVERAEVLGFDAVATGHHARVVERDGVRHVARGADAAKDQSYVVHMLDHDLLGRVLFPVGHLAKADVRAEAARAGLRTAAKPDSQDVCFITATGGRERFLGERIEFRRAAVVDEHGAAVGEVPALELVTVGQRRGLGLAGGGAVRYALDVDPVAATVTVGPHERLLDADLAIDDVRWAAGRAPVGEVLVQCSAHGAARPATVEADGRGGALVRWRAPERRVAPGQSVVVYDAADTVALGAGTARRR